MASLTASAVLTRNYLFRGLSEETIEAVASLAMHRSYEKGAIVFSQGDEGDALYGVASGRVRIGSSGADGREVFFNIMTPGDTFGEIALIDGLTRTATATAIEKSALIVIPRPHFLGLLEREPKLSIHLLKLFCERVRWTSELVEEAALLAGPARVAKRLISLVQLHGRPADGGTELRISQSELAHFLGITRQIVNQYLQVWREAGWIDLGRARILVRDIEALRQIVSQAGLRSD